MNIENVFELLLNPCWVSPIEEFFELETWGHGQRTLCFGWCQGSNPDVSNPDVLTCQFANKHLIALRIRIIRSA